MRRWLVPLTLLVLTACSSGQKAAGPVETFSPPTVETETPSPTPAAPTTSPTSSSTPTATPTARRIPALPGDVDGDGTKDAVRATAQLLTVDLSSSGTVTAPVHTDTPGSPAILGYADIDRDGRSEVFLETAEGASTQFATPYRYDGKKLLELQLDEGPARLGMGGTATHGDGFRCKGGTIDVLSSDSTDGTTYTVHVSTYRIHGAQLLLVSTTTVTGKHGDPLVEASYRPDCGTVGD